MKFVLIANKYENSGINIYNYKIRPILLKILHNIKKDLQNQQQRQLLRQIRCY